MGDGFLLIAGAILGVICAEIWRKLSPPEELLLLRRLVAAMDKDNISGARRDTLNEFGLLLEKSRSAALASVILTWLAAAVTGVVLVAMRDAWPLTLESFSNFSSIAVVVACPALIIAAVRARIKLVRLSASLTNIENRLTNHGSLP